MLLVNNYAIVPAAVRYDKRLSLAAIVVFMEVSASSDGYGICERENSTISSALGLTIRTVTRAIAQLIQCGHLVRLKHARRLIQIIPQFIPPPQELQQEEKILAEDIKEYSNALLDLWEQGLNCELQKREMFIPIINQRLVTYTKEELLSSIKNRIHYVTKVSDWHMASENKIYQQDISILLRDDDAVFKYLNMKAEPEQQLKKFES